MLQIQPVIAADQNIYVCHDKAYNLDTGLLGTIKSQSLKVFWFSEKNKFYKLNPSKICKHHCAANKTNMQILDYLSVSKEHLDFV